jgi:hypothetical protein
MKKKKKFSVSISLLETLRFTHMDHLTFEDHKSDKTCLSFTKKLIVDCGAFEYARRAFQKAISVCLRDLIYISGQIRAQRLETM